MDITIKFDNFNGGTEDGVRVYRSDAVISSAELPEPLATLPAGTTQYVDTTAVRGSKYYYRFGVFKGTDEVLTKNIMVLAIAPADTGPGPQTLQAGDWDLGYFGYCNSASFISYGGLISALGLEVGTAMTDYGWYKVAYKGKVMFIPRSVLRTGVTYNQIYQAGAVFGTNDNGPVTPTGAVATNQYKLQDIGGFTFIPRLMKGTADGAALPANKTDFDINVPANEYDDIMGAFYPNKRHTNDVTYQAFGRINEVGAPIYASGSATTDLCQQMASYANAGITVGRGGRRYYDDMKISTISQMAVGNTTTANVGFGAGYTVNGAWRPILELVL